MRGLMTAGGASPEPVQIEFLDSGGRRWQRDEDGTLSPAQPS